MLRYLTSVVVEHSDHPYMAGMFVIGGLFLLGGVLMETFTENGIVSGLLAVYAMIAFFLGVLGYLTVFGGKLVRGYMRETDASL